MMKHEFNANIKLLMGGLYCGGSDWDKRVSDIDHCFKLYYLRSGKAELKSENCSFTLEEGNFYFINGYALKSQRCLNELVIEWVHFQPESVYFNHVLKQAPCALKLDRPELPYLFSFQETLAPFFRNQLDSSRHRTLQLELIALIHFTIASVFRGMENSLLEKTELISKLMPALDYITRNYKQPVRLKQLAATCCLSPNYFHRLFTSAFGLSPLNYIRKMRMEEAIRQLVYTRKSVKEVAYATGFEDESYFSRAFSKTYLTSPGRYRKENSNKRP